MAKSMIHNMLGDKVYTSYFPMNAENAATFCEDILAGTWKVFENVSSSGSDTGVVSAIDVAMQLQDDTTNKKTYLKFIAKGTLSDEEIRSALIGLTVNGVKVDKVVFLNYSPLTFA